jgi:hypothetical protein
MGPGEHPLPTSLGQALRLAASPSWRNRCDAALGLTGHVEAPAAFARLVELLDDPDTAVIEMAARSLTTAAGQRGLAEVLQALARSEDNAGYHLRDVLVALWLDGTPVLESCRAILDAEVSEGAREGAREMIKVLTHGESAGA